MSTGTQILLGVCVAVVLFAAGVAVRRRRPTERRPVTEDLTSRLRDLVADGKTIVAISELRRETGMGLREAKDYVDALAATGEPPAPPAADVTEATMARARQLAAAGKVVMAVKAIRDETGWSLKRCKDVVDGMPKRKDDGYYGG